MDKVILKSIAILADLKYALQKDCLPDKDVEFVIDYLQRALDILIKMELE